MPMADLRDLARSLGFEDVKTYIQSGNLIFWTEDEVDLWVGRLETAITDQFGFEAPVMARDAETFASIASSHPFSENEKDDRLLVVAFLDREPETYPTDALPRADFVPDRYAYSDREIYLHYAEGSGRSRLTNDVIERRLGVRSTMRNWRTIQKLARLTVL